jgi:regulator of nucleoside diphosphate kinase
MSILEDGLAESLSVVWSRLHLGAQIVIQESEIHLLRMLALAADDDLVSYLLLRKLRMAQVAGDTSLPDSLISLNTFCEFSFDGGPERFCQLVRPSPYAPSYGVSIQTLTGAGLIGLSAGQTILWPNNSGELRDLHVVRVENCPGLSDWLGGAPMKDHLNV